VLAGHPPSGMRVVITDGAAYGVASNDLSFQLAKQYGIHEGVKARSWSLLGVCRLRHLLTSKAY